MSSCAFKSPITKQATVRLSDKTQRHIRQVVAPFANAVDITPAVLGSRSAHRRRNRRNHLMAAAANVKLDVRERSRQRRHCPASRARDLAGLTVQLLRFLAARFFRFPASLLLPQLLPGTSFRRLQTRVVVMLCTTAGLSSMYAP